MDLRRLRYFVAVAEELHFGRAAEKLHMSQPPLSQQIRRLELELGAKLLERNKRRVNLTEVGRAFYHRAKMILDSSQIAIKEVQQMATGQHDAIRLGFMSAIMLAYFPPFLRAFHEEYPQVSLHFQQLSSDAQYEALVDGRIDLGFVDAAPGQTDSQMRRDNIDMQIAMRNRLAVALPAGHHLTRKRVLPLRELANEPFILLRRHTFPSFFDKVIALCQRANFSPKIAAEGESLPVVLAYVAAGVGVSILPQPARLSFKPYVSFVELQELAHVDIFMVTRIEPPSQAVQALRSKVIENFRAHRADARERSRSP